jgi:hypothetical protein
MHNLITNIIPGAVALAIVLGGILCCIVADMRAQSAQAPLRLRLRLHRLVREQRAPAVPAARVSLDA